MYNKAIICLVLAISACAFASVTPAPNFKISQLMGFWWVDGSINLASHFHDTGLTTMACPTITVQSKDSTTIILTFNYTHTSTGAKVVTPYHMKMAKTSDAILNGHGMELVVTYFDADLQVAILVEAKEKFVMTLSRNPFFDMYTYSMKYWLMHNVTPPINADDMLVIDNRVCVSNVPILSSFKPKSVVGSWYVNMHYAPQTDLNKCQFLEFASSKSYSSFYKITYHVNEKIVGGDEFLPLAGALDAFWVPGNSKESLVFSYKLPSDEVYLTFTNYGEEGFVISKKQTLDQKESGLVLSWVVENGFSIKNMNIINNLKCTKA